MTTEPLYIYSCEELHLTFLNPDSEVNFDNFDHFTKLSSLFIESDFISDIDFSGLKDVRTLKQLTLIGPQDEIDYMMEFMPYIRNVDVSYIVK